MIIDYPVTEFIRSVVRRYRGATSGARDTRLTFSESSDGDTLSVGFVGDICPLFGRTLAFGDGLRELLASCDHLVGNFEGILTNGRRRAFRLLHEECILNRLQELAEPPCWTLSLANNHAGDFGESGFEDTVGTLERRSFNTFGTRARPTSEIYPGIVLSTWTLWMNRPSERVPRKDPGPGGGFSIAYPHWGYEFTPEPDTSMDVPAGYDLIVGHHTHVPLPLEVLDDGRPVAWSLGNFTTGNPLESLHTGAVMIATFDAGGTEAVAQPAGPTLISLCFHRITLHQNGPTELLVRLDREPNA